MSSDALFFILLVASIVCVAILKEVFRGHGSEPPLLPTNQRPYSGYTEPRSYHPPVVTPSATPHGVPFSKPCPQSSADQNSFTTQQQRFSGPRPLLPSPVPSSIRKTQQYSLSKDNFPGTSTEHVHRPATKAPVQKIVEPAYRPTQEPLPAVRKPQPYSFSRDDLARTSVEPIHQPATKAPLQATAQPPSDPVYQPLPQEPLFGARKPQSYSFTRDDLPRTSIEPIHRPPVQTTVEPSLGSIYEPPTPEPFFGARKSQQYSFSRDDLPRPLIENVYRGAVQKTGITVNNKGGNDDDIKDLDHLALRKLANQEMENMKKCRTEERMARRFRQFIRAKEFIVKGQQHEKRMQELNDRASEVVFAKNNKDPMLRRIDLHGLRVKEAIGHTNRVLKQARELGNSEMRIIVGKGIHSKDGLAKLKPAIQTFLEKNQFPVEIDPRNDGAFVVKLDATPAS